MPLFKQVCLMLANHLGLGLLRHVVGLGAFFFWYYCCMRVCCAYSSDGGCLSPKKMNQALAYFYMVAAWGGYVFIINIIPIYVVVMVIAGRYSSRLYIAYSTFYALGSIMAMQVLYKRAGVSVLSTLRPPCVHPATAFRLLYTCPSIWTCVLVRFFFVYVKEFLTLVVDSSPAICFVHSGALRDSFLSTRPALLCTASWRTGAVCRFQRGEAGGVHGFSRGLRRHPGVHPAGPATRAEASPRFVLRVLPCPMRF